MNKYKLYVSIDAVFAPCRGWLPLRSAHYHHRGRIHPTHAQERVKCVAKFTFLSWSQFGKFLCGEFKNNFSLPISVFISADVEPTVLFTMWTCSYVIARAVQLHMPSNWMFCLTYFTDNVLHRSTCARASKRIFCKSSFFCFKNEQLCICTVLWKISPLITHIHPLTWRMRFLRA